MGRKRKNASILRGLQYFEAVARRQSVKLAAEDLNVTESAVSHQIKDFSSTIGQQLIIRSGRGIALTSTGEILASKLAAAFRNLEQLVSDLSGSGAESLQLSVCSSFGPGLLIGRLASFRNQHPEIDLQLNLYALDPAVTREVTDAFVTAEPVKPGYAGIKLLEEHLIAVRAPQLFFDPARGIRATLITRVDGGPAERDWVKLCRRAGVKLSEIQAGRLQQCSHYLFALEMCRNGEGVALVPDFLARLDIHQGRLVQVFEPSLKSGRTYSLCYLKSRAHEPKIAALAAWFEKEVGEFQQ